MYRATLWFPGDDENSANGFPTLAVVGVVVAGVFIVAGASYLVWNKWIKKPTTVDTIV